MKKSVLFVSAFLALTIQVLHAETMVCPLTEIVADTNPDKMAGDQAPLRITLNQEREGDTEFKLGNFNVLGRISRDPYMDLFSLSLLAQKTGSQKSEIRFSLLLKYAGPSKENGFEGPKGTDKYAILTGVGLDENVGYAQLTEEAFGILKPFGITSRRLWNTSQEIEAIGKAVLAKKLKRGQPIGVSIPFVCWKEK